MIEKIRTATVRDIDNYLSDDAEVCAWEDVKNVLDAKNKKIVELNDKLQNVSSLLNETREWLVESQKLHKRCADNAVKVIAELQAQKAQAEDDCAYWKALAQKKEKTMTTINYNEKDLQAPLEELKNRFNRLCRQSENILPTKEVEMIEEKKMKFKEAK